MRNAKSSGFVRFGPFTSAKDVDDDDDEDEFDAKIWRSLTDIVVILHVLNLHGALVRIRWPSRKLPVLFWNRLNAGK